MSLQGTFFDGKTSAAYAVEVSLFLDGSIQIRGVSIAYDSTLLDAKVSERIGSTLRRITFKDGAVVEVADNDAIDQWLSKLNALSQEHFVSSLEQRWPIAIAALVLIAIGAFAFVRFGVPAIAKRIAYNTPLSVDAAIGQGGLEAMDRAFFKPSELPADRKQEIDERFETMTSELGDEHDYRLEFRKGGPIGPNAFALPSGIVVITDELINLAQNDEEIVAVLAHEVGHVVNRHSLRMLLQNSGTAALMFGLLGDVGSISGLAASLPTVMVHMKHSRDFEREADEYSRAWLREHGIATSRFGNLLKRIEQQQGDGKRSGAFSYFSSHPSTQERAKER
ncbi:MAG TPA: M48 family metallopeptidase [Steroidobacteraceae bacterium]|nr:M48 family metallopeptidase [Steroidobacteraceae bacterium]